MISVYRELHFDAHSDTMRGRIKYEIKEKAYDFTEV